MRVLVASILLLAAAPAAALELPKGYFVWTKGEAEKPETRRIHRLTLPGLDDERVLTGDPRAEGEDVEPQISPDGRWVAFARAKVPGIDYLAFAAWKIYVVSIHGAADGREVIKIDDNGYWPSWSQDGALYYTQAFDKDGTHSRVMRVTIDEYGVVASRREVISTHDEFGQIREVNECFIAPDGSWFAARTRGPPGDTSISGVGAFDLTAEPSFEVLAQAGAIGCQPRIAPSSTWAVIAGRDHGILWGSAPRTPNPKRNQVLLAPPGPDLLCYHPGISTDERWFMAGCSTDDNHNAGHYDLRIWALDGQTLGADQPLVSGGFNGWPHVWVGEPSAPPPPRPHVDLFAPSTYTVVAGASVELRWQTSFADRVTLDGEAVPPDGTRTLTPSATKTYTLEVTSSTTAETKSASFEVAVNATAQPVRVVSFTVDPATVQQGNTAKLTWKIENATTAELDGRAVQPSGNLEVSPAETTEYALVAEGQGGPVSSKVTLTIAPLQVLLPDRGGCLCASTGFDAPLFSLFALFALLRWKRRR